MKQKIVIKVTPCDKCRSKALVIAAATDGVIMSVGLEGKDRDKVVVVGDGVDAACLTNTLRKKVGYASLETVEEVKEKAEKKNGEEKGKKKEGENKKPPPCVSTVSPYCEPQLQSYTVVYDPYPPSCIIM